MYTILKCNFHHNKIGDALLLLFHPFYTDSDEYVRFDRFSLARTSVNINEYINKFAIFVQWVHSISMPIYSFWRNSHIFNGFQWFFVAFFVALVVWVALDQLMLLMNVQKTYTLHGMYIPQRLSWQIKKHDCFGGRNAINSHKNYYDIYQVEKWWQRRATVENDTCICLISGIAY